MQPDMSNINEPDVADIEQMRRQLSLLHQKLDRQAIVSDRLVRDAVRTKAGSINRDAAIITTVALLSVPYCVWLFNYLHLSCVFTIVTVFYFLVAVAYDVYSRRGFRASELSGSPLAEIARRTVRMKLLHARWLRFSIPFLVVWISWFVYEILSLTSLPEEERTGILIGGAVGGVLGATVGYFTYRRTQRLAAEIIEQVGKE